MDQALADRLVKAVDTADKLVRWQIAVMSALVMGAVWCTTINMRLSAIETDRNSRIPIVEQWRGKVEREDQKRDDLISEYGSTLVDHGNRITDLEHQQREWLKPVK